MAPATLTVAPSLFDAVGGEPTLDETIAGAWEGLIAHRGVQCPICEGHMLPEYGAQALPIGGKCQSCATTFN